MKSLILFLNLFKSINVNTLSVIESVGVIDTNYTGSTLEKQVLTPVKCGFMNGLYIERQFNLIKTYAVFKGFAVYVFNRRREIYVFKAVTVGKSVGPYLINLT